MENRNTERSLALRIAIVVLAILLVLSAGALAARFVYNRFIREEPQAVMTVRNNVIGEEGAPPALNGGAGQDDLTSDVIQPSGNQTPANQTPAAAPNAGGTGAQNAPAPATMVEVPAASMELYQRNASDNQKFSVENMLPGDVETGYYRVRVYHDRPVTLSFMVNVTGQTKELADVLHIKVTRLDTNEVVLDAPFDEIDGKEYNQAIHPSNNMTEAQYQIDVSLDTSVGNAYQASMLTADFKWYVNDTKFLIDSPQTGDSMDLALWSTLAASALALIAIGALQRRKEAGCHE